MTREFQDAGTKKRQERASRQVALMAQLATVAFICGTLTWRGRTADQLTGQAVDSAGAVRLALDLVAAGLVFLGHFHARLSGIRPGRTIAREVHPGLLYGLYIAAALLSASFAVDPALVLFRVFDLGVCLAVAVSVTYWCTFDQVLTLIKRILLGFVATLAVGVVLFPATSLLPARGGIWPYQLAGSMPILTVNTVGTIGLLIFAIYLGTERRSARRNLALILGLSLIAAAQYRTGYIAVAAVVGTYLLARRNVSSKLALVLAVPVAGMIATTSFAQNAWIRGEQASNSVATLSGRTQYWEAALNALDRSPVFGLGLSSGTRLEVLNAIGHGATSTIHNTWIEAYVGTGIVGITFFSIAVLQAIVISWRYRELSMIPLLLMASLGVRTLTGTSIELASASALYFLVMTIGLWRMGALRSHDAADSGDLAGEAVGRVGGRPLHGDGDVLVTAVPVVRGRTDR